MEDLLMVPRDVLQRAYDALEETEGWDDVGSEPWIAYHQIGSILHPDPAFIAPIQRMQP